MTGPGLPELVPKCVVERVGVDDDNKEGIASAAMRGDDSGDQGDIERCVAV